MIIARQSTARTVTVGPVLDADGVAVTDGVVGDFKIAKNGAAPAALNGSATLTHRNTGHYSLALTATDLDTVGQAEVVIDDTVNACPMKELTIVEEAVYDALYAASAPGYVANAPVNVAQLGGDTQSATDLKDFADAGYDPSTNKVQGVVLVDTLTTYTGDTPQTGDSFGRIGATGSGLTSLATQTSVNDVPTVAEFEARTLVAASYGTAANQSTIATAIADVPTNSELATALDPLPTAAEIRAEIDSNSTKTGYKLASDGLDSVSTTAPAGVASNFREMLVQTWRRFFKKSTLTSTELKTYADNGTSVLTTQAVTDAAGTQTQNAAS
jgi:hypothetical protein